MFCKYCGNQIPDSSKFCPSCGATVDAHAETQLSLVNVRSDDADLKLIDFLKNNCVEKRYRDFKTLFIVALCLSALSVIVGFLLDYASPVDGLLFLGLSLWFTFTCSKASAITTLILGVIEVVFGLLVVGELMSYYWVIIGILMVSFTVKAFRAYNTYKETGMLDSWAQGIAKKSY